MPQKPLTSKGNKSLPKLKAANRHGKVIKHKKGGLTQKPKKDAAKQHFEDQKELTKIINKKNEAAAASKAEQSGGHLGMVKAPPAEGKDKKKDAKSTKA
ncbi:g12052 [Coccomyxa viridis]|uniref:G12052 protein n=1 Tax=Coccomyxa viridis TaxID=1274662 RepID=A0ABP1G9D7_9CHLO